jgi:AAA domain
VIDVETRFPIISIWDAYERSQRTEQWVFHETICSSLTLIYGRSNVGKSYLIVSMLLSLLTDREFLGMQPTDPTKLWKPCILWTDPGGDEEYARRMCKYLPEGVEVPTIHVGRTTDPYEWRELTELLLSRGYNFVVVDNLTGIAGDTNDPQALVTVFDGLTRLTNLGIPVVVIHHESEKGKSIAGAMPLGLSTNVQKARVWIQVRQTSVRGLRGGNTGLIIRGNALEQPQELIAEPTSPNYRVLKRGPWDPDKPRQAADNPNARIARWVVDNCQGIGVNQVGKLIAEEFGGAVSGRTQDLKQHALSKLLNRTGSGLATTWKLA